MARRFSLKFKTGPASGQSFSLGPGEYIFMGSGDHCVIRIKDDPSVSETHACVYHDPVGVIRFKDMGSQFGTFKNGRKINGPITLKAGDRVTLGQLSTFQSSWWNALQVTRLTRFSALPSPVRSSTRSGPWLLNGASRWLILMAGVLVVSGLAIFSDGFQRMPSWASMHFSAENHRIEEQPGKSMDQWLVSGALSAKLFLVKPKKSAKRRVEMTPERKFIWDEIVSISRRFGDPPPTAMDPRFVREVERHLKNFTRGGYHRQLLARKALMWPTIEAGLTSKGLPVELGFIVWVESSFQSDVVSPVGAFGPWQFMPDTAREYNLRVGGRIDERRDLAKSTRAAADYFADLLRMFGTERYLLAVASYNSGQNRVKRLQIAATVNKQRSSDFWHLRAMLPDETVQYVPKFMAAVIIGRNPDRWDVAH